MKTNYLTKASLIAGIYIVLIVLQTLPFPLASLTFGPVQIRIAEGLTLLPLIESAAIPGLFVGCLISNIILVFYSGFGIIDVVAGSLVTLIAAYLTSKMPNKYLGMLPPILLNGLIVSIWVSYFTGIPYIYNVIGISLGELASILIFGNIFLSTYKKALTYIER